MTASPPGWPRKYPPDWPGFAGFPVCPRTFWQGAPTVAIPAEATWAGLGGDLVLDGTIQTGPAGSGSSSV